MRPAHPPPGPAPTTPGFLVPPEAYRSYCAALASRGVPCVLYGKQGESAGAPYDDIASRDVLLAVMEWCDEHTAELGLKRREDVPLSFLLAGHSRGAKVAALAAEAVAATNATAAAAAGGAPGATAAAGDEEEYEGLGPFPHERVASLVLLDPVDGSYDVTQGPRWGTVPFFSPGLEIHQGLAWQQCVVARGSGMHLQRVQLLGWRRWRCWIRWMAFMTSRRGPGAQGPMV